MSAQEPRPVAWALAYPGRPLRAVYFTEQGAHRAVGDRGSVVPLYRTPPAPALTDVVKALIADALRQPRTYPADTPRGMVRVTDLLAALSASVTPGEPAATVETHPECGKCEPPRANGSFFLAYGCPVHDSVTPADPLGGENRG